MPGPVKLYGIPRSRAFRCLVALEETGVEYELVPTDFTEGVKSPAFRAINPNAKIPALVDGETVLFESLAINLYLMRKYGDLWPRTVEDEGRVFQWTLWTATEIEPPQMQWAYNTFVRPADQRDPAEAAAGAERLKAPLGVLETVLADRDHLLGAAYSPADLQVSCVLYTAWFNGFDLAPFPKAKAWLDRCLNRPAVLRARNMREAA
ncbi:glutathione S-transferase family protein [Elioraea sp. Yellowstone]|jgi:glutathione S-transferase|uniref:glutathione S-transferase family protein n=1 Tax=Elioraea sp. Yellowstone TaxID=2592070 RepID=UPI00114E6A88|nr:glutathione S-transferase family protein [Elioraea sp. Yellowstone]TQF77101.1 glutathione S-transferase family protein [Elioraea sp. Yellowstone]